jgi:nicotinamide riboside transporter PnuC
MSPGRQFLAIVTAPGFIWSTGLAVIGLIGMEIAGRKSHWGWFIGLCAQVLWVIFATVTMQYGFYLSAAGYGWMYGKNWWKWRKEHRAVPTRDRSADWSV